MEEVVGQLDVVNKTASVRAWNGLSVGNPCSVVDTERTLFRLNPNSLGLDRDSSYVSRAAKGGGKDGEKEELKLLPSIVKESQSRSGRNARRVFSDGGTRGGRNLMELMARIYEEPANEVVEGGRVVLKDPPAVELIEMQCLVEDLI